MWYYNDAYRLRRFVDKVYAPYYFVRRVCRWLKKSVQYSIFLWHDWDFDYSSLLRLMQFKIKRMRKNMTDNDRIVDAHKIGDQMKLAELLLERILEDDYCKLDYENHKKRWGKIEHEFLDDEKNPDAPWKIWHIKVENANTPDLAEQERAEYRKIMDRAEKLKEQDYDVLFKHIRKYVQRWWD